MRAVKNNNAYEVVQHGTLTRYWKNNYAPNGTIVGTLTNDNAVISGFSDSKYLQQKSYPTNITSMELFFKVKTGSAALSSENAILGQSNTNKNTPQLAIDSNKFWFGVATSTSASWISVTGGTVTTDTEYYVRATWNGSRIELLTSTDGVNFTSIGTASASKVTWGEVARIGDDASSSDYWRGSIDLKESYINVNGSRWWDGAYISSTTEVTSSDIYDYTTTEDVYKCWGTQQTIFESSTGGDYTVSLEAGDYEITCVGGGGAAAMRGVYDDKGYGWGGGSGGAVRGLFTLPAGVYNVTVGSANNNTKTQSGNTQTLNPSDMTTHDSYVQGVVVCGGGGSGHYNSNYVGSAGLAPVFTIQPNSLTLNTAGNVGKYNSGGKGSASPATCAGGASVYAGYGKGQGCKTSEYASNRSWINGTGGYVRIIKVGG